MNNKKPKRRSLGTWARVDPSTDRQISLATC